MRLERIPSSRRTYWDRLFFLNDRRGVQGSVFGEKPPSSLNFNDWPTLMMKFLYRASTRAVNASFAAVLSIVLVPELAAFGQVDEGNELVVSVLEDVTKAIADAKLPDWDSSQEVNNRWGEVVVTCKRSFEKLLGRPDERVLVRKFVSSFGSGGAESDFAILMAVGRYGIPSHSGNTGLVRAETSSVNKARDDLFRSRQLFVAECQTRLFLEHPERLERYCYFLIWGGFLSKDLFGHYKRNCAERMATGDYWWHARNALVLNCCTGDIRPPKDADSIHKHFQEWLGSVSEFEIDVFDRRPTSPFPDWNGPKPISGQAIRQLYD